MTTPGPKSRDVRPADMTASRAPHARKIEIERAIKGVRASGLKVTRVEIIGSRIIVSTDDSESAAAGAPLDDWRSQNGQG